MRHRSRIEGGRPGSSLVSLLQVLLGGGLGPLLAKCESDLQATSLSIAPASCNATSGVSDQSTHATRALDVSDQSSCATTTSGLILNYVAEPTGRVYNIATDCENITANQIPPPSSGVLSVYCQKAIAWGGVAPQKGTNNAILAINDIIGSISYSLAYYVQSCAMFNSKAQSFRREDRCRSITFESNLNDSLKHSRLTAG
jgi:hypothetical protein